MSLCRTSAADSTSSSSGLIIKGAPINEHRPPAPVSRQEPVSLKLKTKRSSHWPRSSERQANCTPRTLHQHSRMASVQMRRKGTERSRLRRRHLKATPRLTEHVFTEQQLIGYDKWLLFVGQNDGFHHRKSRKHFLKKAHRPK